MREKLSLGLSQHIMVFGPCYFISDYVLRKPICHESLNALLCRGVLEKHNFKLSLTLSNIVIPSFSLVLYVDNVLV